MINISEPEPAAATAFYVYARSGERTAFPVGPFDSKEAADEWVDPTRSWFEDQVDGMAGFYEWGVAKLPRAVPGLGRFNDKVMTQSAVAA